jgi:HEAT repeat protein
MLLWWDDRRRLRLWEKATELCRVDAVETSGFWEWRPRLTARAGSIEVQITGASGGNGVAVVVVGPLRPAAERLHDETLRRQLLRASASCNALEIGDGRLRAEVSEEKLPRVLPILFSIGRRLAEPLGTGTVSQDEPLTEKSQLLYSARRDPKPSVRLSSLLALIREYPGDPDTLEVLRGACMDPISKVRVRAAIEVGDDAGLLRIAERSSDDASCALAVSHLGSKLPLERVRDILARSLRKGARAPLQGTARACMEVLGHHGAAAIGILAGVMTEEKGELAAAAAQALGATGEVGAEPHLIQALQNEDGALREAAAAILGRIGTAAAVQPLREASERSWLHPRVRPVALQAIAEIQSRLQGAAPGQLSLAQAEAGQLSLATDAAGQLSLPPEEAGRQGTSPEPPGLPLDGSGGG